MSVLDDVDGCRVWTCDLSDYVIPSLLLLTLSSLKPRRPFKVPLCSFHPAFVLRVSLQLTYFTYNSGVLQNETWKTGSHLLNLINQMNEWIISVICWDNWFKLWQIVFSYCVTSEGFINKHKCDIRVLLNIYSAPVEPDQTFSWMSECEQQHRKLPRHETKWMSLPTAPRVESEPSYFPTDSSSGWNQQTQSKMIQCERV